MDILKKVKQTIKKHSMLKGGERVLAGLSGGPDSVSLLHILNELREEWRLSLYALYVDHGLRPEKTPYEIDFCTELTERLKVPFSVKKVDVREFSDKENLGIQEAARHLRYLAFEEHAFQVEADRIATGHNADDQAETLVMRLLRGSGPRGLSGIPPVRGMFIRPLIMVKRSEIEKYLDERGIGFVIDTSNLKQDYLRNRLRHEVMPLLKKYNPNLTGTLCRTANILREENEYMEIAVTKSLMRLISRKTGDKIELFISPLENMEKVILRRALIRAIEETRGLRGIGLEHIEEIISLIRTGSSGSRIYLPGGLRVIKDYSTLIITSAAPRKLGEHVLQVPGETVLKESGLVLISSVNDDSAGTGDGKTEAAFDFDMLRFPLKVRSRQAGDFFYPSGFGKRKKLQDYFVDEKVPRDTRDTVPLLLSGEDIIWVVGYRMDDRYMISPSCARTLKIIVKMAK
ncbi:tRNA(Ile)-lysidine synthetase [hydrothermal vent metagenome]|uniref:tRNA(Ile)-lysidine synthetase n=1 Tax=hydrothermal vent metagenome TaxID=652676 RepID=A0A3B1DBS6_9ZZZZ